MVGLPDFDWAARRYMNAIAYTYYRNGAAGEWPYRNNLEVYSRYRLRPRVLTDITNIEASLPTTILGYNFSAPFFISPCARADYAHPEAEANLIKGAAAGGILYMVQTFYTSCEILGTNTCIAFFICPSHYRTNRCRQPIKWISSYLPTSISRYQPYCQSRNLQASINRRFQSYHLNRRLRRRWKQTPGSQIWCWISVSSTTNPSHIYQRGKKKGKIILTYNFSSQ